MRIITPQDAAFDPSGDSSGVFRNAGGVNISIPITADIAPVDVPLFTSPGGTFLIVSALTLNTAATTGNFQTLFTYTFNGASLPTNSGLLDLSIAPPNNVQINGFFYADSGTQVLWSYEVTGFSGGPASVDFSLQFYRVA
jgi:hypothetical protein